MAEEFSFDDDIDPDRIDTFETVLPGRYIGIVANMEENGGPNHDKIVGDYQIIGATTPGMLGRTFRDFTPMNFKEGNRKKRLKMAIVLGLTSQADAAAAKKAGKSISINWADAAGRLIGFDVEEETGDNGKTYRVCKWSNNIFDPKGADAQGIPVDQAALRALGIDDPFGGKQPGGAAAPKASGNGNGSKAGAGGKAAAGAATTQRMPSPALDDPFA